MFEHLILEKKNLTPVTVHKEKIKYLFGLFTISYILEDSRPDLTYGDGEDKSSKYKHQIRVCIFGKPVFTAVIRSYGVGFVGMKSMFEKDLHPCSEITNV